MRGVGGIAAVNVGGVGGAADYRGPCMVLVADACAGDEVWEKPWRRGSIGFSVVLE